MLFGGSKQQMTETEIVAMQEEEEADLKALLQNPNQHTPANPECENPYCPCHFNAMREEVIRYARL